MQRAENAPDAFFRFTMGKTSLFAVFAAESRSARFSGARNKSLHHAPHPAVVPVPYSHRHRRAKFWRPDSKSFCRFCAAAVPRDRQTGSQGISRSVRTYTNFTSFRLSCGLRRSKNRETAGIFGTGCGNVGPRTRTQTFPTWSGLHPDTPHPCVSAQCNFRFSSASSSIRSLRSVIDLRRAGSPLACCR